MHINYGQRTESRELKAFHDIAGFFDVVKKLVIDYSHLEKIGGSSLTDKSMDVSKADLTSDEIPTSYVPFRNAHILTACISWTEIIEAEAVFIGAVFEDAAGYPDCRPKFFKAFEKAANMGTKPETKFSIETPVSFSIVINPFLSAPLIPFQSRITDSTFSTVFFTHCLTILASTRETAYFGMI